jgi:TonB family protein
MSEIWTRWEGRKVDGRFLLQSYVSSSDDSAVFLTFTTDSRPAAIKLIFADAVNGDEQLGRWESALELHHPNLIRIFDMGRCEIDGAQLLYVVEECAEENLAQILPERALTAGEVGEMLPPILRALQFLHEKGFAHGRIQPSNILAIGNQVKVSSDNVGVPGETKSRAETPSAYDPPEAGTAGISPAGDVWLLGMTLVEALTQRLPGWDRSGEGSPEIPRTVPQPFREIAQHCLQVDPGKRWTVRQIIEQTAAAKVAPVEIGIVQIGAAQFNDQPGPVRTGVERTDSLAPAGRQLHRETSVSARVTSSPPRKSAKWAYVVGVAAMVVIAYVLIARSRPSSVPSNPKPTQDQQRTTNNGVPPAPIEKAVPAAHERPAPNAKVAKNIANNNGNDKENGIVQRVMPEVSPAARRTIQGTIKVRVKVEVDVAGNVTEVKVESAGPSKYFLRIAVEAARGWKFSPAQSKQSGAREWRLQYAFSHAKTEARATAVNDRG